MMTVKVCDDGAAEDSVGDNGGDTLGVGELAPTADGGSPSGPDQPAQLSPRPTS